MMNPYPLAWFSLDIVPWGMTVPSWFPGTDEKITQCIELKRWNWVNPFQSLAIITKDIMAHLSHACKIVLAKLETDAGHKVPC